MLELSAWVGEVRIGFTGTRLGMTALQLGVCEYEMRRLGITSFHHGDCVGADAEAHQMARALHARVYIHPPIDERLRAHCGEWHRMEEAKNHFARNRDIVNAADVMIATPWQMKEPIPSRGGTWYTVSYARKQGKRVLIVWPDGNVLDEAGR